MRGLQIALSKYWLYVGLSICLLTFVTSGQLNSVNTRKTQKLSCEIPDKLRIEYGRICLALVVINTGEDSVIISGLNVPSRYIRKDQYEITFSPDSWVSQKPRPEKFFEKLVILGPGERFSLPIDIPVERNPDFPSNGTLTVLGRYSISTEFSQLYSTWYGMIETKPVTIRVTL